MPDITVGYAMTVGGASTGQAAIGGDVSGLYSIEAPGDREAIFDPMILSVTGIAAGQSATVIISDDIDDVAAGGSAVTLTTPTFPRPARGKMVMSFQAPGGLVSLDGVDYPTDGRVYLLVIGGATVFGYLVFKWILPTVRQDWPVTTMDAQAASVALLHPKESRTWQENLRQIPAAWSEKNKRRYPNQPIRPPAPGLYETARAEALAGQGPPDLPASQRNRRTRG